MMEFKNKEIFNTRSISLPNWLRIFREDDDIPAKCKSLYASSYSHCLMEYGHHQDGIINMFQKDRVGGSLIKLAQMGLPTDKGKSFINHSIGKGNVQLVIRM